MKSSKYFVIIILSIIDIQTAIAGDCFQVNKIITNNVSDQVKALCNDRGFKFNYQKFHTYMAESLLKDDQKVSCFNSCSSYNVPVSQCGDMYSKDFIISVIQVLKRNLDNICYEFKANK